MWPKKEDKKQNKLKKKKLISVENLTWYDEIVSKFALLT